MKKEELLKTFGKNIKSQRKQKHLTQESFAEISDVSIETISNIERGILSTTIQTANQLAKALEMDLCDLLDFSSDIEKAQINELKILLQKYTFEERQNIIDSMKLLLQNKKPL